MEEIERRQRRRWARQTTNRTSRNNADDDNRRGKLEFDVNERRNEIDANEDRKREQRDQRQNQMVLQQIENEDALEVLTNSVFVTENGMVSKQEFDFAMMAAQNALKAKTRANQLLTIQAKAAMQNAVTALKITENEAKQLRKRVDELTKDPDLAVELMIEDALGQDREQLRVAKERVKKLSNAFRMLQNEVGKEKYARGGGNGAGSGSGVDNYAATNNDDSWKKTRALAVAMEYPVKLDKINETRVVVLAQQGYALDDCERAIEDTGSTDLYELLDWLEERECLRAIYDEETLSFSTQSQSSLTNTTANNNNYNNNNNSVIDQSARVLAESRLIDTTKTESSTLSAVPNKNRQQQQQQQQQKGGLNNSVLDDDDNTDPDNQQIDSDDDERSSFELGDEFDYAKYDSSNLRLTAEELYFARARAVRVLCACAIDPPARQELEEKEKELYDKSRLEQQRQQEQMKKEFDDNEMIILESSADTSNDSLETDESDADDGNSEDLNAKRREKEARMNTKANERLNSSSIRTKQRVKVAKDDDLKDPEVLRNEFYIQREKMAFSFRAVVALTKLAEASSSSFFVLHNGGLRAATECLRKYGESSSSCARASFALIRQFATADENNLISATTKHFMQTERFRVLPLLVLRAIEARKEDFDVVSDGLKCTWTLITLGGDRTRNQLLKNNIALTIRDALAIAKDEDEQYRGRRFKRVIGCGLAICLHSEEAQKLFTSLGIPGLIRAKLIEFPSIKFSGEFADLRDWLASNGKRPKTATATTTTTTTTATTTM